MRVISNERKRWRGSFERPTPRASLVTTTIISWRDSSTGASRDDYALAAAIGLDGLDQSAKTKPSEFDSLRRARIYLFNRHWPEARAHLLDIVDRFPESPNRSEALYQAGFTLFREYNYD